MNALFYFLWIGTIWGFAIYAFTQGSWTNGILLLILGELYAIRVIYLRGLLDK